MNEGYWSALLGLRGISPAAEEAMVARDLLLAEHYGARLHIAHVSTAGSVELVRRAKARGVAVTAETAPHYFAASECWVEGLQHERQDEPAAARRSRRYRHKTRPCGRHDRRHRHRPRAACARRKTGGIRERVQRHRRAGNGVFTGGDASRAHGHPHAPKRWCARCPSIPRTSCAFPGGFLAEGRDGRHPRLPTPTPTSSIRQSSLRSKSKNTPFLNRPYKGVIEHTIVGGVVKK